MTARLPLLLALALGAALPAAAQAVPEADGPAEASARRAIRLHAAVGRGTLAVGDFGQLFTSSVEGYRAQGVPMEVQREYPPAWAAEVAVHRAEGLFESAIRLQAQRAAADALYGDYAGTLDVRSRLTAVFLEAEVGPRWRIGDRAWAGVAFVPGGALVATRLTHDLALTIGGEATSRYEARTRGLGWSAGLSSSAGLRVGGVALAARLGVRYAVVRNVRLVERADGQEVQDQRGRLDHDLTGLTLTLGVEL